MSIHTVSEISLDNIQYYLSDTVASVLQNIAVILATPKGSVPMYRDFGISTEYLDLPRPAAEVRMRAEIREAVERWEPRARVRRVSYRAEGALEGKLSPVVEVEILDRS